MGDAIFNSMEIDMLGEILNISLGASATSASNMLSRRVEITTPEVEVVSKENFQYDSLEPGLTLVPTRVKQDLNNISPLHVLEREPRLLLTWQAYGRRMRLVLSG